VKRARPGNPRAGASAPAKVRRTQEERRATTIRKLLDATIDSLLSVGYARTTVQEICGRAGLSHGALFRFFPTVLSLVLAAAEEVGRRQIDEFHARFAAVERGPDPIGAALELVRDACRSPINMVFYELLIAARTDRALRKGLAPGIRSYVDAIKEAARRVPGMDAVPPESLEVLVFTGIHLFDGESLVRIVYSNPAAEEARLGLLRALTSLALGAQGPPSP
jgi:AcrR family transcriptional regulator